MALKTTVELKMTVLRMSKRTAHWIKQQARIKNISIDEMLESVLNIPDDYLPTLKGGVTYHPDLSEHFRLQKELREVIISLLKESNGEMKYKDIVRLIPTRMNVPDEWLVREQKRRTVYPTPLSEYAALENRYLSRQNITLPFNKPGRGRSKSKCGWWRLAEENVPESKTN